MLLAPAIITPLSEVDSLLEAMDEEERQIVVLRLREHTCDDVAETLGCSERTVRRILDRLRQRLEETLTDQTGGYPPAEAGR